MGCSCSKDLLEASRRTPESVGIKTGCKSVPSQESHPSICRKENLVSPSYSTPSSIPLKEHRHHTGAAAASTTTTSTTPAIHEVASPSTPSTLQYDEDENDRNDGGSWIDDDDDEDEKGVDQSDHIESDDEFRRFTEIKDDIQEDLKNLNKLEKEVQQESIQLIKDFDSNHEPVFGETATPPLEPIKVVVTGDDAVYLMKIMRLTHGPPLTEHELVFYRDCVRANVIQDMRVLCSQLREAEFESLLAFSEEDVTTPDIFDTLSVFGQLRHAWRDIRTHGFDGCMVPKHAKSWDGSEDLTGDGGETRMTPRRAFEILVTILLEDEEMETTLESEVPDLFEEEKEEEEDTKLFLNLWREIQVLWQSDELKEFLSERPWLLHDSLLFHLSFLEDIARLASPDYSVTSEDIVDACSDASGTGSSLRYQLNGIDFDLSLVSLDDIVHCKLDDIDEQANLLVFAASLTGFDQTIGIDGVNKMMQSLEALKSLCSNAKIRNATPKVVLTKHDLFVEKMSYSDVAAIADFEDFEGRSSDSEEALQYFSRKFVSCLGDMESNDRVVHVFDSSEDSDITSLLLDATQAMPRIRFTFSRASSTEDPTAEPDTSQHEPCQEVTAAEETMEYIEV